MEDRTIWRYFDILKFIDFISGNLYFSRADKFQDKFEGRYPKKVVEQYEAIFKYNPFKEGEEYFNSVEKSGNLFMKQIRKAELKHKECIAISCWHLNEYESAAMWNIYSKSGYGIAVKTKVSKVKNIEIPKGYSFCDFAVKYEDFEVLDEPDMMQYAFLPCMYKRKSFNYENEYRFALFEEIANPVFEFEDENDIGFPMTKMYNKFKVLDEKGLKVKIDPSKVIDEIILSPSLQDWELEIINDYLKQYNLKSRKSDLWNDVYY